MKQANLLLLVVFFTFISCASHKVYYHPSAENWETDTTPANQAVKHTMFLIGDSGVSAPAGSNPVVQFLGKKLAEAGENSSILFLGDNILPAGTNRQKNAFGKDDLKAAVEDQLAVLKEFKGRPIFIAGNEDWDRAGLKGLKRQEKYIESKLNENREEDDWINYFFPDRGCGGPEIVELENDLVIVIVDSNWWLRDWDKDPEINDGCEAKSRAVFEFLFEEAMRKYRNKNIVVAMHHPLYSKGPRGGYFTLKEHLFPLTSIKDYMYIPMPGIGTLAAFMRSSIGTKQDIAHQKYKNLRQALLRGAKKNGSFIFAAAHDYSLQYIEEDRQQFVVSGAGARANAVKGGFPAIFGYGQPGFAQIDFYGDGAAWLQFWGLAENGNLEVLFKRKIKEKLSISRDNIPESFPEYESGQDTFEVFAINNEVEDKGGVYNFIFGKHYRDLYQRKYRFASLDLQSFKGGVVPVKRGGGNQTNALRLEATNGKEYNMRALTKDASRLLPYPFNRMTAAKDIVTTNFLSTHPFAPLAIPALADAVQVYHTNPALYYIPKQPALDVHNDVFGGGVYLVEERPAGDWSNLGSFGHSSKIISTPDVVEELEKNHKNRIDQRWAVRSRLFDLVIGDWDRHDDQWRWARFNREDGIRLYRPIPRDRDQPFSKYDGVFTAMANWTMPFLRQLRTYKPNIKNMKWSTWSARYFDRSFLTELEWKDWEAEANFIQQNLSDAVIDQAFEEWPEAAKVLTADKIKSILRTRRDNLPDFARRHYLLVAKKVDVTGTNDRDRFEIERIDDDQTRVRMYDLKKGGESKELVYERVFLTGETKEISIYGGEGKDEFLVTGEVNKGILIRLIGGIDEDHFQDRSLVRSGGKKTIIYDNYEPNQLELGREAKDQRTDARAFNIYDRKAYHYEYNFLIPFPIIAYNNDNGFILGADLLFTNYRFKKSPYAATHKVAASMAFATSSPSIQYTGDFLDVLGNWDILLNAELRGPRYTFNYHGFGNESIRALDDRDFYRVRQGLVQLYPALKKRFAAGSGQLIVGPVFERSKIEQTEGRFIASDATGLSPDIFDSKYFGGAKLSFLFENLDHTRMTRRGLKFHTSISGLSNLKETDRQLVTIDAEITIYTPIDRNENAVFATRLGMARVWGDYEFFQAPVLGGQGNLRGFQFDRFYGNTSFYHNSDLRLHLFRSVNSIIPFSFGLHAGFDYGRVWLKGERSDTWHYGYGGGFFVAPVDYIILSAGIYRSAEDRRFVFQIGFSF